MRNQRAPKKAWSVVRLVGIGGVGTIIFLLSFLNQSPVQGQTPGCTGTQGTIPVVPAPVRVAKGISTSLTIELCRSADDTTPVTVTIAIDSKAPLTVTPSSWVFKADLSQKIVVFSNKSYDGCKISVPINYTVVPKAYESKLSAFTTLYAGKDVFCEYMPLISSNLPPKWEQIVNGYNIDTVRMVGNHLIMGDRDDSNQKGGIYRADQIGCQAGLTFTLRQATSVRALAFRSDGAGIAGTFADRVFYSNDGINWVKTGSTVIPHANAVTFLNTTKAYAGSDNGVHVSTNAGVEWSAPLANSPTLVTTFLIDGTEMWIGSFGAGLSKLKVADDTISPLNQNGLVGDAQKVWEIVHPTNSAKVYLATSNGLFQASVIGSNVSNWASGGLSGKVIFSLELNESQHLLYAGARDEGVWQRSLDASGNLIGDWTPVTNGWSNQFTVRDLVNDTSCKGLLAATNNGVWVLR